ncbi:MAG: DUF4091 domain-containing protein, partial [Oscillospiraceae bacterium]|nr:DUF4091 domain-containing protein [Oscillospiraceae bacterium]
MHMDDDQVPKGDALLDWGSEVLEPWLPVQLFLHIGVPADAAPGRYSGEVRLYTHTMFEDEQLAEVLPFEVEVADVALPAGDDRKFHLVIWQHPANIARHHGAVLFSDEHFRLLEEYTRTLSELGNVAATVTVGDIPWAGQFCRWKQDPPSDLFEYNMVRIFRDAEGVFHYDYSILQRYLELCRKYGMTREIYLFGLIRNWVSNPAFGESVVFENITEDYPDAIRLRYVDEADGCGKFMRKASDIKAYIKALFDWLRQEGWLDCCLVSADEPPDMDAYNRALAALREAEPNFRTQLDISPSLIDKRPELQFDSYTPVISDIALSEEEEPGLTHRAAARCKGTILWSTCCWPMTPNTFLRSPLLEGRLHGPVAEWLKVDGFLRWAYTCWPEDPMQDGKAMEWPTGDAFLVYPGKGGRTVYSLRYFAMKRGIGDFELMQMVKRDCPDGEQLVDEALRPLFRQSDITKWNFYKADDTQYSFSPEEYEACRAKLVGALTGCGVCKERSGSL